jgi:hypothetical protein
MAIESHSFVIEGISTGASDFVHSTEEAYGVDENVRTKTPALAGNAKSQATD